MTPSRAGRARGVTLPELLVVVAILGIVSAMFYVRSAGYRAQAQTAAGVVILDQIRTAITAYESASGGYAGLGCNSASTARGWATSNGYYATVAAALAPYATLPTNAEVAAAFGGTTSTRYWRACQLDLSGSWAYVVGVSQTDSLANSWIVGTQAGVYICPGAWPPTDPTLCTRP